MFNLLKSDFYKLKKSKAFWICSAICVVIGVLMVMAMHVDLQFQLKLDPADHEYINAVETMKHTSAVFALKQFLPIGFSMLLAGIFIAIFVASEFGNGTVKTFISTSIRSNGGAIATNILCSTMISYLFMALGMLFGGKIALGDYWLGGAVTHLATIPAVSGDIVRSIIVVLFWGIASLVAGTLLFRKRDVK